MMTTYSPETAPPLHAPPSPPSPAATPGSPMADRQKLRRTMGETFRRHRLLLVAIFCILCSLVYLAAPFMPRTYETSGTMKFAVRPFPALPGLAELPKAALKQSSLPAGLQASMSKNPDGNAVLHLAATASTRHAAVVPIDQFAQAYAALLTRSGNDMVAGYGSTLDRKYEALGIRETELSRQIEDFRRANPGVLPDDLRSITAQFNALATKLDEKQQRLRQLEDTLTRFREYKRNLAAQGGRGLTPPTPLPPAADEAPPAAPRRPELDPEVIALTAQLQLVEDQLKELLRNATEQHPRVVDLRTRESNLNKQLDAARARVATGAPAPPTVRVPQAAAPAADPTFAATQTVDLQIESMQAEHDTLKAEVQALAAQRDQMRKSVDAVLPARQAFERLSGDLEGVKKERQEVRVALAEFRRQFGPDESADLLPGTIRESRRPIEASPLELHKSSTLPSSPNLGLIYAGGTLLGLVGALIAATLLRPLDRSFHHPQEVQTMLGIPVLGVVSEIRSPAAAGLRRFWQSIARPALMVGFLMIAFGSAVLCHRGLANPDFSTSRLLGSAPAVRAAP